jgi:hypothetical protein
MAAVDVSIEFPLERFRDLIVSAAIVDAAASSVVLGNAEIPQTFNCGVDVLYEMATKYEILLGSDLKKLFAALLFAVARSRGHRRSTLMLAELFHRGFGVCENKGFAVRLTVEAIDAGLGPADVTAMAAQNAFGAEMMAPYAQLFSGKLPWQLNVGDLLTNDISAFMGCVFKGGFFGFARNDVKAVRWFRKSANAGDSLGQNWLAHMYSKGRGGLPRDYNEALRLYTLAAKQDTQIYTNVGLMHMKMATRSIVDDEKDSHHAQALVCFRLAAAVGECNAQYNLAVYYERAYRGKSIGCRRLCVSTWKSKR